ncbi:hypothetical protein ABIA31_009129 [Catenulispora sp. MAP5-51]|uniref:hypothetical protein n=1 Tax=Catenulispora sp. MAP5-51 TaxID=3156298 RepID=UPI0035197590
MVRGLSTRRRGGSAALAWTDLGGAVLLHPVAGPDPQVLERCADLAARHEPTLVFLDLPPTAGVRDRGAVAACLADRPGELRLVPVGQDRTAAATLAEWLSHLLGRSVSAPDGDATEVADGWFVPATAGAGWTRYEPGRIPVAHSRRLPTPAWEGRPFAEPRELGGGVRVEPLPAGAWITGPGAPQAADSLRKWLTGGLQMDPGYPRVVVGHPGPASVPLAAVQDFWEQLDEQTKPMVRFAEFGATDSADELADGATDPGADSFGQALADLFATPVVAATGVPVLAPWGSGGSRIRVLLPNGAMHWRPYVWDLRYLPRAEGKAQDPEPVGYRAPIEGLAEVASGVYEYAPDAVLEVTRSGLWMRPPEPPRDASAVRSAPIDPGRSRVFHAATGTAAVAERMRRLAAEVLPRLETEVRKLAEVLPSTAAITLIRAAADPAAAGAVAAWEADAAADEREALELLAGPVAAPAEATVEEPAEATVEEPAESLPALGLVAGPAVADIEGAPVPALAEAAVEEPSAALPALGLVAEPVVAGIEAPPVAEAVPEVAAAPILARPASAPPPIGRFSLESGPPTLDLPLPAPAAPAPVLATAVAAPVSQPLAPGHTIAPTEVVAPPVPEPIRVPAAPAQPPAPKVPKAPAAPRIGARVQPVPSAETTAVPPSRSLDLERQWLRRNLGGQYDATVGSVARILSEFPGLRAGGAPTADVLVDLVAVQLYLAGHTRRFDDLVRSATGGPHVPLARCIASGLRRLPSHRGPVLVRAALGERDVRWYGGRKVVTEWGFAPCVTGGRLRLPGAAEVLIWSMTARRTHLVAPEHPDQVVFLPGTSFKVLSATTEDGPRVLLRELSASEVGADGRIEPGRVPLDDVALAGLAEAGERWRQEESSEDLPEALHGRFGSPPGLIVIAPTGSDKTANTAANTAATTAADATENRTATATTNRPPATAPGGTAS